jgi:hypothetical protein
MVYQILQLSQLSKAWQLLLHPTHLVVQQVAGVLCECVGQDYLQGGVAVHGKAPGQLSPANCSCTIGRASSWMS